MKTCEELIYEWGNLSGGTPEKHIYDYFVKLLGDTVASYEIDRINLVAMTLERDAYFREFKDADKRCGKVGALYEEYKALYENTLGRVNGLEEWLTEYRDQLKKENVYHKNQGIINAINELLNGE